MKVLVIDNRDSFVFNLVEELATIGHAVTTLRGDAALREILPRVEASDLLVFSPGPGSPDPEGLMSQLLELRPEMPCIGVCLGMQLIALHSGGEIQRSPKPRHGVASQLTHGGNPLFDGVPRRFRAARYHSLCVVRAGRDQDIVAWADDGVAMALVDRSAPRIGLQFHPESILSPNGPHILRNALRSLAP